MPIGGGAAMPLVTDWTHNATLEGATFYPLGGDVLYKAESGNGADLLRVTLAGGEAEQLNVPGVDHGIYSFNPAISPDGRYVVYMGGNQNHEQHRLYSVEIGYRCEGKLATMVGTPVSDAMVGTKNRDVLVALGGADDIVSGRGADRICAGSGSDVIRAGPGGDLIFGHNGHDEIIGGSGKDDARGGGGLDIAEGNAGNDHLRGGSGDDELRGGGGNDVCLGGSGTDTSESCETISGVA